MAFIRKRGNRYCVVYKVKDEFGKYHQRSESYADKKDAEIRKKEIIYKSSIAPMTVRLASLKTPTIKDLLDEYVKLYGRNKWGANTYASNLALIDNYILPTIGSVKLSEVNTLFVEKYYRELLETPAVSSTKNKTGEECVKTGTIMKIHKLLRSAFQQALKWELMEKNPATYASVPKHKKQEREIWTAEMLAQAIEACENKNLKIAFHLAFAATLRMGELLGLTWDCVDISKEAIRENRAYVKITKEMERVTRRAVEDLDAKDILLIFPSSKQNNKTVRVLKTPKTESSVRKIYIPRFVAECLVDLKKEQEELKEIFGCEYQDYNLVMATSFGLPLGESYLRIKMQEVGDKLGFPKVVFHSLRHTSITYKLKLSGGDIKAVQGDSGHSQADMVTEVYGHIIDEDRRKNAELLENAFYKSNNLNPQMKESQENGNSLSAPEGVDVELVMKLLENPEMLALMTSLAKVIKGNG